MSNGVTAACDSMVTAKNAVTSSSFYRSKFQISFLYTAYIAHYYLD